MQSTWVNVAGIRSTEKSFVFREGGSWVLRLALSLAHFVNLGGNLFKRLSVFVSSSRKWKEVLSAHRAVLLRIEIIM